MLIPSSFLLLDTSELESCHRLIHVITSKGQENSKTAEWYGWNGGWKNHND